MTQSKDNFLAELEDLKEKHGIGYLMMVFERGEGLLTYVKADIQTASLMALRLNADIYAQVHKELLGQEYKAPINRGAK